MQWLLMIFIAILLINLLIFGAKILFWVLAFADFAVVVIATAWFTHSRLEWHTVFVIIAVIVALGIWFLIMRIPIVQILLPCGVIGLVSWGIIYLVNYEIRVVPLDNVWTWAWRIVIFGTLVAARFWALSELDMTDDMFSWVDSFRDNRSYRKQQKQRASNITADVADTYTASAQVVQPTPEQELKHFLSTQPQDEIRRLLDTRTEDELQRLLDVLSRNDSSEQYQETPESEKHPLP